jgi:tRNA(Ile)-lysidine synthetase-like protein
MNTIRTTKIIPTAEIINFWFPNNNFDAISDFGFWFDTTPDEYIRSTYIDLVDYLSQEKTNYLKHTNSDLDKLSLLIIGDQFTRNAYRNDQNQRTKNDFWTLDLAISMIDSDIDLRLNLNMRYFILLVLRHQKTTPLLNRVISRIKLYLAEYVNAEKTIPSSLIKFYTHSIRSYTSLIDSVRSLDELSEFKTSIDFNYEQINNKIYELINLPTYVEILDKDVYANIDNKNYFYNTNLTNIIYKTLCEWVNNLKSEVSSDSNTPINIGISLSGGVDSMVLLSCLVQIKNSFPELIRNIIAVHIEHSNRSEAILERQFLIDYCQILGVKFYWRTIDYMCREMEYIDRSVYEIESKKVRFGLYKYVSDKYGLVGFCMGHHMGDITENVFTNIIKGRSVSDLGVMKKSDIQLDVQIHRPLLDLIKDQIFSYAKNCQIPFFKNSTPPWSCRGVIRDKMIPILKAQFGDFEPNIIKMMNTCSKMADLNNKYVIQPFIDSVIRFKHGIKVPYNYDMTDDIFWDPILIDLLHSNGYPMISTKSKNIFLSWLKVLNIFDKDKTNLQCDLNSIFYAYYNSATKHVYIINNKTIEQIPKADLIKYNNLDEIMSETNLTEEVISDKKRKKLKLPQKIKNLLK